MMEKTYSSFTLKKCLLQASKELNIPINNLKYNIIEEKRGLFKKKVVINVLLKNENDNMNIIEKKDGIIGIKSGKVCVSNPENGGRPAKINICKCLIIKVNGEKIEEKKEVYNEDTIDLTIIQDDVVPKRNMEIKFSSDKNKMKAYLSTEFIPKTIYKVKDTYGVKDLNIDVEEEKTYLPFYTEQEIKDALSLLDITFGIKEEAIQKISTETENNDVVIAEGVFPIDQEQDYIEFKFGKDKNKFKENEVGTVDYKSIGTVESFKKDDIIAEKVEGKKGVDGKNVKGEILQFKVPKSIIFRAAEGCILSEDGKKIVSLVEGKASFKNGCFFVRRVHEVASDVNLKTGDIKFSEHIVIKGNVMEGMKVEGGSTVVVEGYIESSEIISKGDITIKGNVMLSKIYGGGTDVLKLNYINNLNALSTTLEGIVKGVKDIKRFKLVEGQANDGSIIKSLIDTKFKNTSKMCMNIIRDSLMEQDYDTELIDIIKKRVIGLGPLQIKDYNELNDIIFMIKGNIELFNNNSTIPVSVNLNYCQDSNIHSTGNIVFKGKGQYISNISSNDGIYFEQPGAISRGGRISAKKEIKARIVGSSAGVVTTLMVEDKGHIYVDTAYQNTTFVFGEKEGILEIPSKDVHAYMGSDGNIVIDRLKL